MLLLLGDQLIRDPGIAVGLPPNFRPIISRVRRNSSTSGRCPLVFYCDAEVGGGFVKNRRRPCEIRYERYRWFLPILAKGGNASDCRRKNRSRAVPKVPRLNFKTL
jgi:hypothetical protein